MTHPTKQRGNDTDHKLTPRQQAILDYFRESQGAGKWATLSEVGDAVGLKSKSSVAYQVRRLCDLGYLDRVRNSPRAPYGLTDARTGEMQPLPRLGQPTAALKTLFEFSRRCADLGAVPEAVEEFNQASRSLMKSVFTSLAAQTDAPAQESTDA